MHSGTVRVWSRVAHLEGFAVRALLIGLASGLLTGCSGLLDQEAASSIAAENLDTPAAAPLLAISAIASFSCAQTQVNFYTGLIADELIDAQPALVGWDLDRRTVTSSSGTHTLPCSTSRQVPGLYTPLSVARYQADDAVARLEKLSDDQVANRAQLIGQVAAYAGYSLALLGESMCSAAIDVGPELTPAQLFTEAETRFTKAIDRATAAGDNATLNMARLGRARVRLDLNKKADARADAVLIPAGFQVNAAHSTTIVRTQNRIYDALFQGNWASVDPSFRGLTFGGVPDLRVGHVTDVGRNGADNITRLWRTDKFPSLTAPSPIGKYAEAQLIIAEIDGGQAAVDIINALHDKAGLPHFTSTDPAEIQAQVIQERSRELFLEGHRLWDMIRFALPLVPPPGAPFKSGGTYGSQLCVPLPDVERLNNPNID
jgi:hypothetical protein